MFKTDSKAAARERAVCEVADEGPGTFEGGFADFEAGPVVPSAASEAFGHFAEASDHPSLAPRQLKIPPLQLPHPAFQPDLPFVPKLDSGEKTPVQPPMHLHPERQGQKHMDEMSKKLFGETKLSVPLLGENNVFDIGAKVGGKLGDAHRHGRTKR